MYIRHTTHSGASRLTHPYKYMDTVKNVVSNADISWSFFTS